MSVLALTSRRVSSLFDDATMTSLRKGQFVHSWLLNVNSSFSFLISKGFSMRIRIHTSFLVELRQEYCLTSVLGGLGGLRGDVPGVGNPSDDLENFLDKLGTRSADFGASQPLPLLPDTSLYAFNRTGRLRK